MHPTLSRRSSQRQKLANLRALARDPRTGAGLFERLIGSALRERRRRRIVAELEALDDRLLRDIGLYRSDIPRLVAGFTDRELGLRAPTGAVREPRPGAGAKPCPA